jgi:Lipocalin-like domain
MEVAMARSSSPAVSADVENNLIGVWTLESFYSELRTTGDRKAAYGARPNGYTIFTPEKRMMVILTAEHRATPDTDEKCITAFRSMFAYSGIYRVDVDRFITKVDISWNEAWTGTEQVRFFKFEGDRLMGTTAWMPDPNTLGNPEFRGVSIWRRVKAQ